MAEQEKGQTKYVICSRHNTDGCHPKGDIVTLIPKKDDNYWRCEHAGRCPVSACNSYRVSITDGSEEEIPQVCFTQS
ncbi:hypothetical protein DRH14_02805 [Candidatus Shapirobacteria bacterium]|nr:MAG: hypothetical protein DRH14_02805 [Candidatus Shapirobacteria bacterium]